MANENNEETTDHKVNTKNQREKELQSYTEFFPQVYTQGARSP